MAITGNIKNKIANAIPDVPSNVSYPKTDFGSESPDMYVTTNTKIAGLPIGGGIEKERLKMALDVPEKVSELENDVGYATKTELNSEETARRAADDTLYTNIEREAAARMTADRVHTEAIAEYEERVSDLEEQAHTHENKELLDEITYERVEGWDKAAKDGTLDAFTAFRDYVKNALYGITDQFRDIYNAVGFKAYNGSYFGAVYDGMTLDGGSFTDRDIRVTVDGGDFSQRRIAGGTEFATAAEIIAAWNEEE